MATTVTDSVQQRALQWITSRDTGISSETIWSVMMGCPKARGIMGADVPHDPADFGRCYRLLKAIPEWRERLAEVAQQYSEWTPLVREWPHLTKMYVAAMNRKAQMAPSLYERMRELIEEGRAAAAKEAAGSAPPAGEA